MKDKKPMFNNKKKDKSRYWKVIDDEYGRLVVRIVKGNYKGFEVAFGRVQIKNLEQKEDEKISVSFQYDILQAPSEQKLLSVNYKKFDKLLSCVLEKHLAENADKIAYGNPYKDLEDENTEIVEIPDI